MRRIRFNKEKDRPLIKARGVGFKKIGSAITKGGLVKVIHHPNIKKYPKQKILLVRLKDYIYVVPFIEEKDYIFLKTIYPSHRYTEKYLKKLKVTKQKK